jgi:acyl carrier protein
MEKDEIKKALLELIEEVMPELEDVAFDKNIVTEYGVNSISIIKLIVESEKRFEVSFTDYELALESYETFGDLVQVIYDKLEDVE